MSDHIRYLPDKVSVFEPDWLDPDRNNLVTYYPGLVDVRAYPQLAECTVPRKETLALAFVAP